MRGNNGQHPRLSAAPDESATMGISDWPVALRPRERLISLGAHVLSDAELLAIFLRTGLPGCSAIELAQRLLLHFGSLGRLCNAAIQDFCAFPGLGPAKFAQLQAVLKLARRTTREELISGAAFTTSAAVRNYLHMRLANLPYESFTVVFLDVRHCLIACEERFRGTLTRAHVYPREVVRSALRHNAAAVILAHNHPSGVAKPSSHDYELTQLLNNALGLMEVRVLDHLILAGSRFYSFAEHREL
ncbi:MAG: DNA repair protein RadC [Burkholderiaceae bacterium]